MHPCPLKVKLVLKRSQRETTAEHSSTLSKILLLLRHVPQYWHGGKGASSDHRIGVVRVEDKGGNDSSRRQQLHGLSWFMVHHGAHRHLLWRQEAVNDDGQSVRMDLIAPKFVLILT